MVPGEFGTLKGPHAKVDDLVLHLGLTKTAGKRYGDHQRCEKDGPLCFHEGA